MQIHDGGLSGSLGFSHFPCILFSDPNAPVRKSFLEKLVEIGCKHTPKTWSTVPGTNSAEIAVLLADLEIVAPKKFLERLGQRCTGTTVPFSRLGDRLKRKFRGKQWQTIRRRGVTASLSSPW